MSENNFVYIAPAVGPKTFSDVETGFSVRGKVYDLGKDISQQKHYTSENTARKRMMKKRINKILSSDHTREDW